MCRWRRQRYIIISTRQSVSDKCREAVILTDRYVQGVLVASTHRGMSALNKSGGVTTMETQSGGMTRAPLVRLPTAKGLLALFHLSIVRHCPAYAFKYRLLIE